MIRNRVCGTAICCYVGSMPTDERAGRKTKRGRTAARAGAGQLAASAPFLCGVCGCELKVSADDLAATGSKDAGEACRCVCGLLVCLAHAVIPGLERLGINPRDHTPEDHTRPAPAAVEMLISRLDALLEMTRRSSAPVHEVSAPRAPKVDPVAYMHLVSESVCLRIAAGHHPDDAMLDAAAMLEAYCNVHIDGKWPPARPDRSST